MLHWDNVWKEHESELDQLSPERRVELATACLEEVLNVQHSYFLMALNLDQQALVRSCLDTIKAGTRDRLSLLEVLEDFVDDPLPTGVWDIFMGLSHLLNHQESFTRADALEVMSFAYQSILDLEIISKLETEVRESEIRMLEAANHLCVQTIRKQLSLLSQHLKY